MIRRSVLVTVVVAPLACLLGTSTADARRPATKAERAAVAQTVSVPPRCAKVHVSTINPRYASHQWNQNGRRCARYASDGIGLLRKRDGVWRYISGMSDCTPKGMKGVSRRVYRELTRPYCRRAFPYLTDDEAVEQILGQLTDDGAVHSTEDVEWNADPCERESRAVVTCTYWYENGQGRWEGRTRVRETVDAYLLQDLYVESRP